MHDRRALEPADAAAASNIMTPEDLTRWLAPLREPTALAAMAGRAGCLEAQCRALVETFANEAETYAPLLLEHLRPGARVLEVGSGLGFLANWLSARDVDLTALEPAAGAFDVFDALAKDIAERSGPKQPRRLAMTAEELDPDTHGRFDLIYSFNVLEHIADLDAAVAAMARVLAPGGTMLHVCPNYTFPYEPHLAIPLVPGAPAATRRLFPRRVAAQQGVWDSLNFITARRLRRLARTNSLEMTLAPPLMPAMIERLGQDPIFARRHLGEDAGPLVPQLMRLSSTLGVAALLRRIPPSLLSPMTVILRARG
ncbi:hypothetical protein C882_3332 [Caenispirillum salinarum AK4]|uniref:Uncharacterized protein n=1 Tax=Caenispirillum salinarum AK4 TaxID=1238182 RepID=K9GJ94_9PROT|nr:class I SAM-dependent methyltransferase [Caenispirillum salinarum]EKV26045.1 hypothetical protein C882_3332 [Caenispirillum salinarum AK4]